MMLYSFFLLLGMLICFLLVVGLYLVWNMLIILGVLFIVKRQNTQMETRASETDEEFLRQEAVAVAVSAALTQKSIPFNGNYPLPPTAIVSAWQAVLRSQVVKKQRVLR